MTAFRRRAGVRPSPVFLAVVAITVITGGYLWRLQQATTEARVVAFVFLIAGWVLTLCLHEFAHAYLAWRFGDREVESRGYLRLDPFRYAHPVLSILLPILFIAMGGIGLPGGAVYLHVDRLGNRVQRALVSLAGPVVNLLAGAAMLVAFRAGYGSTVSGSAHTFFWLTLAFLAFLQITAAVLNILPIPGLDGYGMLEPYLKPETRRSFEQFKQFGMLIVFAIIAVPQLNTIFFDAVYKVFELSGVPGYFASAGNALIRFWRPL